ncbi:hypothetical protein NXU83_14015 [Bacteroides thetaiotaomicron]|jgi:hypothetical protein|uniref:hypothetical protein n=1 Tax=Bacteroides thetaiotaomicron TaxID=818 RepID=UPI0021664342|nr:hypothetical protein [Bacteroides thetaiotaomicron]MCS3182639.1 hypothetical protein [Bacteroides thetaiotaomicron]
MGNNSFKSAQRVLIFDGTGRFVSRVGSMQAASKLSFVKPQSVSFACSGKYISAGGFYYRRENSNVKLEDEDWNNLKLAEYDKLCGEKRAYHSRKVMAKKYQAIAEKLNPPKTKKKGNRK